MLVQTLHDLFVADPVAFHRSYLRTPLTQPLFGHISFDRTPLEGGADADA
jgi:hypothetical protein